MRWQAQGSKFSVCLRLSPPLPSPLTPLLLQSTLDCSLTRVLHHQPLCGTVFTSALWLACVPGGVRRSLDAAGAVVAVVAAVQQQQSLSWSGSPRRLARLPPSV